MLERHTSHVRQSRSHLSKRGLVAFLIGVAMVALEFRYGIVAERYGFYARALAYLIAVSLAAWGLIQLIIRLWPKAAIPVIGSRRNRFMIPVEGRIYGLIAVLLFCGSAIGHSNPLLLVSALMAGPFIVNGSITYAMLKKLSVVRRCPRRVMAGEPFSVELELSNPKAVWSAWLMSVCDRVGNGREELQPEVLFTRVARRSKEAGRYQLRLSQRGKYTFGPLQVNSRFPLGLVERGFVLAERAEILVYPRLGRLTAGWRRMLLTAPQLVSHAQPRRGAFNDDFHRIREYRPGDELRSIHWRTSARRNELMVREFRESRDRHLLVMLDTFLPSRASAAQRQRMEYAISLAATICMEQLQSGSGADLYCAANGLPFQEWGGSSAAHSEDLYDMFALLRPHADADMRLLVDAAHRHQTPHSRIVLVTGFAERAEQWDAAVAARGEQRDGQVAYEPPQLIVADPHELAQLFALV